jgi:hypothetical protein
VAVCTETSLQRSRVSDDIAVSPAVDTPRAESRYEQFHGYRHSKKCRATHRPGDHHHAATS